MRELSDWQARTGSFIAGKFMPMSSATLAETNLARGAEVSEQECLAHAFVSFTQAAHSLERSYAQLQSDIGRLRAELEQANAELEKERESARKLQALAEVSTMLAHEIRNPLGSMELFASLLAESKLSPSQNSWIHHIQAGLRILATTVNNVLQFHADGSANLAPTDVGEFLHGVFGFLAPLAQQTGAKLKLRNSLVGVRTLADAHRLQQVIFNLVLNALQAVAEGGQVVLAGERVLSGGEPWIQFEVSDNGSGMTEQQSGRAFEPGFTTRPGSAGLGLAVCKKLVEQHGGNIFLHSPAGQGTTVMLRIPGAEA
jgi:signal transduction histidine kinase